MGASSMKTVDEVIEEAISLIQQGWIQGVTHIEVNGQDRYCILGAFDSAAERRSSLFTGAVVRVRAVISIDHPFHSVAAFNDAPTTTKEDVLLVLKKAKELGQ